MELTYEWHKAIQLNYKNSRNNAVVVRKDSKHYTWHRNASADVTLKEVPMQFTACISWADGIWKLTHGLDADNISAGRYSEWNAEKNTLFSGHYLRNRSTLDIVVLGYIGTF
jgi:hypothetical protein